jgi:hypothetical protein
MQMTHWHLTRHYSTITSDTAYSKQDMTEQTVLYLHQVVEVCVGSINIILWSVPKLFADTTYRSLLLRLIDTFTS